MVTNVGYVYILLLKNEKYYIGSSIDYKRRFEEHCAGQTDSLKHLRPLKLLHVQEFEKFSVAREVEIWLKKQKSREIIEIFMDGQLKKYIGKIIIDNRSIL